MVLGFTNLQSGRLVSLEVRPFRYAAREYAWVSQRTGTVSGSGQVSRVPRLSGHALSRQLRTVFSSSSTYGLRWVFPQNGHSRNIRMRLPLLTVVSTSIAHSGRGRRGHCVVPGHAEPGCIDRTIEWLGSWGIGNGPLSSPSPVWPSRGRLEIRGDKGGNGPASRLRR